MSKVSFKQAIETPTQEANSDDAEVSQAIAPAQEKSNALATQSPVDDFIGEATREDIRLPYLTLVGRTSQLAGTFPPGSFVVSKEAMVSDGKKPITITVLRGRKRYRNNVPFEDEDRDERTRIFDTPAEVKAAGGVITYEKGDDNYSAFADFELLIEKPEDLGPEGESHFFTSIAGKDYAHVMWTLSGSAYSGAAVPVLTARLSGHLKATGFKGGSWMLTSKLNTKGKLSWYSPVIRSNGLHTPEFLEALAEEL